MHVPRKILINLGKVTVRSSPRSLSRPTVIARIVLPILKAMFQPLVWPLDIVMVLLDPCGGHVIGIRSSIEGRIALRHICM